MRETVVPLVADCETPYSLTSHLAVAGSISARLSSSPCFLQNSSNDLSVTNVSTTFSWPAEIQTCIWATVTPRRFAALSHVYPSAPLTRADVTRSRVEGNKDGRFCSQNAASDFAVMRGYWRDHYLLLQVLSYACAPNLARCYLSLPTRRATPCPTPSRGLCSTVPSPITAREAQEPRGPLRGGNRNCPPRTFSMPSARSLRQSPRHLYGPNSFRTSTGSLMGRSLPSGRIPPGS